MVNKFPTTFYRSCPPNCNLFRRKQLNARAPNALSSIKELVAEAQDNSLNAQLALERDHFVKNLHHANAGIGIAAFLNKEKPKYI